MTTPDESTNESGRNISNISPVSDIRQFFRHARRADSQVLFRSRRGRELRIFSIRRGAIGIACLGVALGASLSAAPPANAYCPTANEWPGSFVYAGIGNAVPASWDPAIKASMKQWNNIGGANWTIQYTASSDVTFTVSYRVPEGGFGAEPGRTRLVINNATNYIVGGNIFLNPAWSWNVNGNMNVGNQVADVRTVTVHELGHELRLTHPYNCGSMSAAEKASAMNPAGVKRWNTNSDDEAGSAFMK